MLVPEGVEEGGDMLPQKMLKTGSPKMQFSVFWLEDKRSCFSFQKITVAFFKLLINQPQSILTSNEQMMMKTKLRTFAR